MPADSVPDAIAALVAAVLTDWPGCEPASCGRLIVRELRAQGWRIEAPETAAAPQRLPLARESY